MDDQATDAGKARDSGAGTVLPTLLSDHPEKRDAFGAHTAIAKSLAEIILKDKEGRCVALQGAWGSGKSTVIGMLTDDLKDKADIFLFDTWSNQGDPLRYSLMGAFADWVWTHFEKLRPQADDWKRKIDESAHRTTRDVPEANKLRPPLVQWLTALLLIALPVGLALASDQWGKLFGDPIAHWIYGAALVLVVSPFLYLLFLWFFYGLNLFTLVATAVERTAEDTKRIVVRRGPLATSLEFGQRVSKICKALHENDPERKLVIVFDNIDRVAEQNSAKVWSLLTALLEVVHHRQAAFKSNIWVLVPVDLDTIPIPVSVGRALPHASEPETDGISAESSDDGLKLEFLQKTFQLNIVVPPPLQVATERYFREQFMLAFGKTTVGKDWYECYAVLRELRGAAQAFTPRAIKRFINDMVGLWRARHYIDPGHMPSIALMTLYLCERDRILHPGDVVDGVISGDLAPHIFDENPTAALAAIAFGAEMSKGLEILVSARVDSALKSGETKPFDDVVKSDGFAEAVASYVRGHQSWLYTDTALMAKVYRLVGLLDPDIQAEIVSRIAGTTRTLVGIYTPTGQIDEQAAEGFAEARIFAGSDEARLQMGLQGLLDALTIAKAADYGVRWHDCVHYYVNHLREREVQFARLTVALPEIEDLATQVLHTDIKRLMADEKVAFTIKPTVAKSIEQSIIQRASEISLDNNGLITAQTLRKISPGFSTLQACASMQQRLVSNAQLSPEHLAVAIALIDDTVAFEKNQQFNEQASQWMRNGYLYHHYNQLQGDKFEATIRFVGLEAALPFQSAQIANWNQSTQGRTKLTNEANGLTGDDLSRAVDLLCKIQRFRSVISQAHILGLEQFRQQLLTNMLEREKRIYSPRGYCRQLLPLYDALSVDLQTRLTAYAVDRLQVDKYLTSLEGSEPHIGFIGYARVGQAIEDGDRKREFYRKVGELLSAMEHEWWKNTVNGSDQTLFALVNAVTGLVSPGWLKSAEARRVIEEHVLHGGFVTDANREAYTRALFGALPAEEQRVILLRVKNKAVATPGDATEFTRFSKLADFMFKDDEVLEDIKNIVISILIPAIEHHPENRELVRALVETHGVQDKVTGDARKRLLAALQSPPKDGA